jgi:hypothetical protein
MGIVAGGVHWAGCIILLGRWMNWAAYGRSGVVYRTLVLLVSSRRSLDKLQYPASFEFAPHCFISDC